VTVFAFNVVVGTNYGYLNAKPSAASALDLLGPWPWYLLAEVVIVAPSGRSSPCRGRPARAPRGAATPTPGRRDGSPGSRRRAR
jgi:hypothetical protein